MQRMSCSLDRPAQNKPVRFSTQKQGSSGVIVKKSQGLSCSRVMVIKQRGRSRGVLAGLLVMSQVFIDTRQLNSSYSSANTVMPIHSVNT